MALSKKDYEAIAKIIRYQYETCSIPSCVCLHRLKEDMADYFAKDNPRFDRIRFMAACRSRSND